MPPVLLNHDATKPIGWVAASEDGTLLFEVAPSVPAITHESMFEIFGGAGFQVLEGHVEDGVEYVRRARIHEFSFCQKSMPAPERDDAEAPRFE